MSETAPDPADVHTGTDRVELTDAEKWLIPHLTQLDAAADARDVYAAVGSIVAARLQELTAERDMLRGVVTRYEGTVIHQERRNALARLDTAEAERDAARAEADELRRECDNRVMEAVQEHAAESLKRQEALRAELAAAKARCAELEEQYEARTITSVHRARERDALQASIDKALALVEQAWPSEFAHTWHPNSFPANFRAALTPEGTE